MWHAYSLITVGDSAASSPPPSGLLSSGEGGGGVRIGMGGGGGGVRIGMNLYIGIDQLLCWGPHTSVSSERTRGNQPKFSRHAIVKWYELFSTL